MKLNKYIDHTNLKADANEEDIIKLCNEAKGHEFASVCVNGCYVQLVAKELGNSTVKTCAVIGFPLGAMTKESKVFEAENAVINGAQEIDMVINIGEVKNKNFSYIEDEIRRVISSVKNKALVKVIIETSLLTNEEKIKVCEIAVKAGADFVKTSTGFSTGGATVEDVKLMKETVGEKAQVKASGGIKTKEDVLKMIEAGASRIGTSSGIKIVES